MSLSDFNTVIKTEINCNAVIPNIPIIIKD